MARRKQEVMVQEQARLLVPLEEARARVKAQLERGECVPNESVNENDEEGGTTLLLNS